MAALAEVGSGTAELSTISRCVYCQAFNGRDGSRVLGPGRREGEVVELR